MQLSSQAPVFCLFWFCFYELRLNRFLISTFPTPAHTALCGTSAFLQETSPKFPFKVIAGHVLELGICSLNNSLFYWFLPSAPNFLPFAEPRHPDYTNPLTDNGGAGGETEGRVPVPRKHPLHLHGQSE